MANIQLQTQSKGVLAMLESPAIAASLQNHVAKNIKVSTFIAFALNFARRNPSLLNCDRASVLLCLQRIGELGLLPDGRDVALIPFGQECTMIIQYHGLKKLMMGTGLVAKVRAENIHENDIFEHDLGIIRKHTWDAKKPRGEWVGSYCMAVMKNGDQESEIMSADQVEAIRQRSKTKDRGPWKTDPDMMRRKTPTRRLCNQSQWGIDIPGDDDDASISSMPAQMTPSRVNAPSRPTPELEPSIEIEAAQSPTKTPATEPSKPVDAPEVSTPMKSLAAIRARLIKEGISEHDFAGYLYANDLAGLPADEMAGIAGDLDKHIEAYRQPKPE